MATVFKIPLYSSLAIGLEFYDVRIAYLVIFVVGTVLSLFILILGLIDNLPPKILVFYKKKYNIKNLSNNKFFTYRL
jgi:hypothetical protein